MVQHAILFVAALLAALLGPALPAQKGKVEIKYLTPDKIERATKTDEAGLTQWAPYVPQKCPTCAGTGTTGCAHCDPIEGNKHCLECGMKKTAPCRTCGGSGNVPDPLEKALCPACMGAGAITCSVCGGRGNAKFEGSGDKVMDCVSCKDQGGWPCTVCKGARLVDAPALKPKVGDSPLAQLTKAHETVDATLKAVSAFTFKAKNTTKETKEYMALLTPATTVLPALKRCQPLIDEVMKNIQRFANYVGHEEREAACINQFKQANEYYLKYTKRLLELCIARAEANQKAGGDKKGPDKGNEKKED